MLRKLAPLVISGTLLLTRVRPSNPVRLFSTSTTVYRRDPREEIMGNQVSNKGGDPTYSTAEVPAPKLTFPEDELKSRLSAEEYHVTQEKGR